MKLGFIGQGWIGKNYADSFEDRGFDIVRYAKEAPYDQNKDAIASCDIVFIAVPTPTTPSGFDASILREVVKVVGKGKTAVIKSTLLPGTTESIQAENPDIYVLHAPEFLREASARHDVDHPDRTIVGIPNDTDDYRARAQAVIDVLPKAPYEAILPVRAAELVKYGGNAWLYLKVVYVNMLYDLVAKFGVRWEEVRDAMAADPRIGKSHLDPVHAGGRGAGGHCFIKDLAAFREIYDAEVGDMLGVRLLEALEDKNIDLLVGSGKDLDLLRGVYGERIATTVAAAATANPSRVEAL